MDDDRFDSLTRKLGSFGTRRSALAAVLGGGVSLLGLAGTYARRKGKKRKGKKKRRQNQSPSPPPPPPPPFCIGKDHCGIGGEACAADGSSSCFCYVAAGTGEPFCGNVTRFVPCAECVAGEVCINTNGPACANDTGCGVPCPNPL